MKEASADNSEESSWLKFFKKFFHPYFWLGITILLTSIIIDNYHSESIYVKIFKDTYEAIGVAVLVSAIFTYASGTSEFIHHIRSLLEDIIIKRNFLRNINHESKMEALSSLVKPSTTQKNIYSNIESYYDFYLSQTMCISEKNVRSNYHINCRAFHDKDKDRIGVECTYTYRVYKSHNGFEKIIVGFHESEKDSICHHIIINAPDGERKKLSGKEITFEEINERGEKNRKATIDVSSIPNIGSNHDRLDIELKITEYGFDHWMMLKFKALQPTDGFHFHLHCDNDIGIREHCVFVVGSSYYVDIENPYELAISCNQWIIEGAGLSVLMAIPCDYAPPKAEGDDCKVLKMPAAA